MPEDPTWVFTTWPADGSSDDRTHIKSGELLLILGDEEPDHRQGWWANPSSTTVLAMYKETKVLIVYYSGGWCGNWKEYVPRV